MVVLATMLVIVSAGSVEGAASVYSLVAGQYAPAFWGGIVLLGLVAPFIIEGYPVFITKRVETSMTSMVAVSYTHLMFATNEMITTSV